MRSAFARFNAGFEWMSSRYARMTARFVRATALILVVYVGLISLTGFQFARMPTGFIPGPGHWLPRHRYPAAGRAQVSLGPMPWSGK